MKKLSEKICPDKSERDSLSRYYFKFVELRTIHNSEGYGDSPRLAEGFTERLCRELFELEVPVKNKREFDLIGTEDSSIRVEVKATSGDNHTTTYNPRSKFSHMIWVYIPASIGTLTITIMAPPKAVTDISKSGRKTLSLKKLKNEVPHVEHFYQISKKHPFIKKLKTKK